MVLLDIVVEGVAPDGALLMNPSSKQKTYKVVQENNDLYLEI